MVGLLIRHGLSDAVGRWLAGRREGVPLNPAGRQQAEQLSAALRWAPLTAIYTSPLERAVDTARPIARVHELTVETREALTEMDFGAWTGKSFAELSASPDWQAFNSDRCHACPPGGEPLVEVQRRIVEELVGLSRQHAGQVIAVVTHAELIRCAIASFEGCSLDDVRALEISPAHVSTVGIAAGVRRVLSIDTHADASVF